MLWRGDYGPSDGRVVVDDLRVVNDYRRPDGVADHHKSYGHLRTPELSRIVAGFLAPDGGWSIGPKSGRRFSVEADAIAII